MIVLVWLTSISGSARLESLTCLSVKHPTLSYMMLMQFVSICCVTMDGADLIVERLREGSILLQLALHEVTTLVEVVVSVWVRVNVWFRVLVNVFVWIAVLVVVGVSVIFAVLVGVKTAVLVAMAEDVAVAVMKLVALCVTVVL